MVGKWMNKQLFSAKLIIIILFIFITGSSGIFASDILDLFKIKKNSILEKEICELARKAVITYLKEDTVIKPPTNIQDILRTPAPVFVTIVENGKVRGCMGTVQPSTKNAASEIIRSAVMAATIDPWNKPLEIHELDKLKFIISITGKMRRVESMGQLDPKRFGLLVRKGNRSALLLPGEALTTEWQLFQCKKKAGIPQNEPVEMFIFETVTFGPL
jgi:AmmeMemoRadiSam system protein A